MACSIQEKVNSKLLTASATVQKVAGRLLEERNLDKTEVHEFYATLGEKLRQYMSDKESMIQATLIHLTEDAVDMALCRSGPSQSSQPAESSTLRDMLVLCRAQQGD